MLARSKAYLSTSHMQTRGLAQAAAEAVHKSVAGDISDAFASMSCVLWHLLVANMRKANAEQTGAAR